MARHYKKKLGARGKKNYNEIYMERAVAAVKSKRMSIRQASEQFGVPYTTLNSHVHGRHPLKYGRQPALSELEESQLVNALQVCAKWGFPLKPIDIRGVVQQYLTRLGTREKRFKNNLPGVDWFKGFMRRHPELTTKLAENTKRVRAALSYETIAEYFRHLEDVIKDVPACNIINYDETNFVDDPGSSKVVLKRGTKHAYRTLDASKTSTTVMFAISADGNLLPPYVVYKAKHAYQGWTEGGLDGARYNRTQSGWFDATIFEDWFYSIILPYFKNLDGRKVIIGDNLNSHITVSVIEQCENNNIKFVLLPPNSTHLLQPLDVAYFRPLKASWRKTLEEWKLKNRGVLPKTLFPRMLKKTVENIGLNSQANCIAGFKACGIVPFNPNAVLHKIPRKTDDTDRNIETSWTSAIIDHLDQLKTGTSTIPKRGKKYNIVAGKSVSITDVTTEETTQEKKKRQKRRRNSSMSMSDNEFKEESDLEIVDSESDDLSNELIYEMTESSPESQETQTKNECLSIGDFVVVEFHTNKRDRLFIAKIEDISKEEEEYTVNTLRRKGEKDIFFVYPENLDLSIICKEQILKKINLKGVKRGRHQFHLNSKDELLLE